jgi:adenylosuccinate synthase
VATVVVVGAQWGDEAKGKVVDLLAQEAAVVVRYGGGSNAGHTVMVGDLVLKLHLVPSGILNPNARCVMADGMVIDPVVLVRELDELERLEVDTRGLLISPNAHVILPYHQEIDRLEEQRKAAGRIGTTMQGVGPAYQDKAHRCGIRIGDLVSAERFAAKLDAVLPDKNFLITQLYGGQSLSRDAILERLTPCGERIRPFVGDTASVVYRAAAAGQNVVFEGAQGTMLDIDHGTYPFVTSSHPVAGGACIGTGIGPKAIDTVIGIVKAYTTRVGAGEFPTELLDETGDRIRERGREYGTTTGRPRRIGWLDTVCLRYAARVNGLDRIAISLLDVLSGFSTLRLCTAYEVDGQSYPDPSPDRDRVARARPVYEDLPGWEEEIHDLASLPPGGWIACEQGFDRLPANAQRYVRRVEELVGVPVCLIGVGPRRDQTILLEQSLFTTRTARGARRAPQG